MGQCLSHNLWIVWSYRPGESTQPILLSFWPQLLIVLHHEPYLDVNWNSWTFFVKQLVNWLVLYHVYIIYLFIYLFLLKCITTIYLTNYILTESEWYNIDWQPACPLMCCDFISMLDHGDFDQVVVSLWITVTICSTLWNGWSRYDLGSNFCV